jgi:hypothetical protein
VRSCGGDRALPVGISQKHTLCGWPLLRAAVTVASQCVEICCMLHVQGTCLLLQTMSDTVMVSGAIQCGAWLCRVGELADSGIVVGQCESGQIVSLIVANLYCVCFHAHIIKIPG